MYRIVGPTQIKAFITVSGSYDILSKVVRETYKPLSVSYSSYT